MASIGAAIGGAAVTSLLSRGDNEKAEKARRAAAAVKPFTGGGLTVTTDPGGGFTLKSTEERRSLIGGLRDVFRTGAASLRGLLPSIKPGFGRLSESRRQLFGQARARLGERRQRIVGDLAENLSQRRISGSSFGQALIGREEAEIAREGRELDTAEREAEAGSFLQELELTMQTIGQITQQAAADFQAGIADLNLQAEVALQLSSGVQAALSKNAEILSNLAVQSAQGTGAFVGDLVSQIQREIQGSRGTPTAPGDVGPTGGGGGF